VRGGLRQADGDLEPVVIRYLLHEAVDLGLGRGERGGPGHGALHELGLDLHVDELALEIVHGLGHLLEVPGGEGGVEGLDDGLHGLAYDLHLGLRVEARHDGVEAGGEAEVVHVLGALADGVLGVYAGAVHVALLDRLLHLELLLLLLLLALARLTLQRLGGELEVEDLVHQLLGVPHGRRRAGVSLGLGWIWDSARVWGGLEGDRGGGIGEGSRRRGGERVGIFVEAIGLGDFSIRF
jgi:hypothetical protein